MNRREFIKLLSTLPLPWYLPSAWAETKQTFPATMVLLELKGGNDGLNTLIPYKKELYYQLRPNIALRKKELLPLNPDADSNTALAHHPALAPLHSLWQSGQLAWIQGLGYPKPNLSHFRSIEIWETASPDTYRDKGWLAQAFELNRETRYINDGISLGFDFGPMNGGNTLAIMNPRQFFRQAAGLKTNKHTKTNSALEHILRTQEDIHRNARAIRARMKKTKTISSALKFPLARQLNLAANLINAGIPVPVIKVSHGGFDTHSNQMGRHARLLDQLAQALAEFHNSLKQRGLWDQVLLLSYSEFGRRPAENASRGTDHGTASAHLLMGGRVRPGLFGEAVDLSSLHQDNLTHTVDFRSLYATVLKHWFGHTSLAQELQFPTLKLIT